MKISDKIFESKILEESYKKILEIAKLIKISGGKTLIVGGFIRDILFKQTPKDFDIEVYGLSAKNLEEILKKFGKVYDVGKTFGVLKISLPNDIEIDISLPRKDSKMGKGHRGFNVETYPDLNVEEAASRRDFTINSIAWNPLTEQIYDPFNGLKDLKSKILRVTNSEKFGEDPLRAIRALQFVARFELKIETRTKKIIRNMIPQLKELPKERFLEEWKKLFLRARKPSLGLIAGMELGIFAELYPEFSLLPKTQQDSEWHPEGDVWTHTLICIDAAANIIRREKLDSKIGFVIMLSVFCHDFGKSFVTEKKENRIVSPNHQSAGIKPTKKFLNSIGADNFTKDKVLRLVENHLSPFTLYKSEFKKGEKITDGAIRRLANRLHPATISELVLVAEADYLGKGTRRKVDYTFKSGRWLLNRAASLRVKKNKPEDIVKGKDLLTLGFEASRKFGIIIELANYLRDEKKFTKNQIIDVIKNLKNCDDVVEKLGFIKNENS